MKAAKKGGRELREVATVRAQQAGQLVWDPTSTWLLLQHSSNCTTQPT